MNRKEMMRREVSPEGLVLVDVSNADENRLVSLPFDGNKNPVYLNFIFRKIHVLAMVIRSPESGLWEFSEHRGPNELFASKGYLKHHRALSEAIDRIYNLSSKNAYCIDLNRLSQSGEIERLGLQPYVDYIPIRHISDILLTRFIVRSGRHKFLGFVKKLYDETLREMSLEVVESMPQTVTVLEENREEEEEMVDVDFQDEKHLMCLALMGQLDRVVLSGDLKLLEDFDCALRPPVVAWLDKQQSVLQKYIDYALSTEPLDQRSEEFKLSDIFIYSKTSDTLSLSFFALLKTIEPSNELLLDIMQGHIIKTTQTSLVPPFNFPTKILQNFFKHTEFNKVFLS